MFQLQQLRLFEGIQREACTTTTFIVVDLGLQGSVLAAELVPPEHKKSGVMVWIYAQYIWAPPPPPPPPPTTTPPMCTREIAMRVMWVVAATEFFWFFPSHRLSFFCLLFFFSFLQWFMLLGFIALTHIFFFFKEKSYKSQFLKCSKCNVRSNFLTPG